MHRKAKLAGSWYPGTKESLISMIEGCYMSKFGPKMLPKSTERNNNERKVIGIISPHAGYTYSGGIAANGFHAVSEDGIPDTIILIGSHGGFNGIYIQTEGDWSSPIGTTHIDVELAEEISSNSTEIKNDNKYMIQITDNTFELQLPFIQHLSLNIKLVPIAVGSLKISKLSKAADELSNILKDYFVKNSGKTKNVTIVASTDLTHYGKFNFGFAPADGKTSEQQNEWIKNNDKNGINMILNLENEDIADILNNALEKRNLCCPGAIILALETIKQLKTKCNFNKLGIKLIKQATSFDIEPRKGIGSFSAVGYASIIITK